MFKLNLDILTWYRPPLIRPTFSFNLSFKLLKLKSLRAKGFNLILVFIENNCRIMSMKCLKTIINRFMKFSNSFSLKLLSLNNL